MNKVSAVVVTYNRLELLKQCVDALLKQTVPCDILIINNASTDDTEVWAAACAKAHPEVKYFNTGSNLGGAGGFNYGMRKGVEAGYEYVWIMDDDTLPAEKALEELLRADQELGGNYGWLSSRALWTDGRDCPMNMQRKDPYREIDGFAHGIVPAAMASFVSLFLKSETVKELGLPIKDFFIWSDDWEYTRRLSRSRPCYAVRDSRVVHAMKSCTVVNIATDTKDRLPRYRYFYRNDVYLYRREGLVGWLWLLAKNTWHSAQVLAKRREGTAEKLKVIWLGFWNGIRFRPEIESHIEG